MVAVIERGPKDTEEQKKKKLINSCRGKGELI